MSKILLEFSGAFAEEEFEDGNDFIFSWDKRTYSENYFDIKDFMVFFKFKEIRDFSVFEQEYKNFQEEISRIKSWLKTFKIMSQELEGIYDPFPQSVKNNFLKSQMKLFKTFLLWAKRKTSYYKFCDYYKENIESFFLLRDMSYSIKTSQGIEHIDLSFAENFRFKSNHGFFNFFSLKKDCRDIIVPQEEDSFIYMVDFSQFEFRSFLHAVSADVDYNSETIYEDLGKRLELKDPKLELISYLYAQGESENIKKLIDKSKLVNMLSFDSYQFGEFPVYFDRDSEKNKKIHTVIQTISYFYFLQRFSKLLHFMKDMRSKILFPLHDAIVFSIHSSESYLAEYIPKILESDIYKTKSYIGKDFANIERLYV